MDALKKTGLDRNTVVIFSSDNGDMMGAHGLVGKWLMYEESIRVPLIIYDPRLPKELRGRRCDRTVLSIDLAPTMARSEKNVTLSFEQISDTTTKE